MSVAKVHGNGEAGCFLGTWSVIVEHCWVDQNTTPRGSIPREVRAGAALGQPSCLPVLGLFFSVIPRF